MAAGRGHPGSRPPGGGGRPRRAGRGGPPQRGGGLTAGGARPALVGALVVAAVVLLLGSCAQAPAPAPPRSATATLPAGVDLAVEKVVDGDTIRVAGDERVRLLGIDTPESVKPGSPVECFGKEAAGHLSSLLPQGTPVRLVGDVEQRDRYGRLLAYVYRTSDGLFVNAAMVRDGYAVPLTIPPNVAHTAELTALSRTAREARRGLWSAC